MVFDTEAAFEEAVIGVVHLGEQLRGVHDVIPECVFHRVERKDARFYPFPGFAQGFFAFGFALHACRQIRHVYGCIDNIVFVGFERARQFKDVRRDHSSSAFPWFCPWF